MTDNQSFSLSKDHDFDFYVFLKFTSNDTFEDVSRFYLRQFRQIRVFPVEVNLIFSIVGLILNAVNVWAFSRKSVYNSLGRFMIAFEISNMMIFVTMIQVAFHYYNPEGYLFSCSWMVASRVGKSLRSASIVSSNWLAVAIGIYRCLAVTSSTPLISRNLYSRAVIVAIFVGSAAILCGQCFAVTYDVWYLKLSQYSNETRTVYRFIPRESFFRHAILFSILSNIFIVILPVLIMVVSTSCLVCSLSRASVLRRSICNSETSLKMLDQKQRRDRNVSLMLIMVLVTFVLGWVPHIILQILYLVYQHLYLPGFISWNPIQLQKVILMDDLIIVVTNAFSFFIYYFMSSNFRCVVDKQLLKPLTSCFKRNLKRSLTDNVKVIF